MKLLYFAWVRQKIGYSEEVLDVPADVNNAGELLGWLCQRSAGHAQALGDAKRLRVAINQVHADFMAPVFAGDEVAFFPPVTGG